MIALMARSDNNIIGKDGELPWHCTEDLMFFKRMTLNRTIVFGRTTWQYMPTLKDRRIIVLTRRFCEICDLIGDEPSIALTNDVNLIPDHSIICGGGMVYDQLLPMCKFLYLTTVHQTVEGDTEFNPEWLDDFEESERISESPDCTIIKYRNLNLI